eukprot:3941589-Rhodomonas_salina.2
MERRVGRYIGSYTGVRAYARSVANCIERSRREIAGYALVYSSIRVRSYTQVDSIVRVGSQQDTGREIASYAQEDSRIRVGRYQHPNRDIAAYA